MHVVDGLSCKGERKGSREEEERSGPTSTQTRPRSRGEIERKIRTSSLVLEVSSSLERSVHRALGILLHVVRFELVEVLVVVLFDGVVFPIPLPQRQLSNSLLDSDDLGLIGSWCWSLLVDFDGVESIDPSSDLLLDEVVSKSPVDDVFVEFLLSDGDGSVKEVLLLRRERLLDIDLQSSEEAGFEDRVKSSDDSGGLSGREESGSGSRIGFDAGVEVEPEDGKGREKDVMSE